MTEEDAKKIGWLRPAMNGSDDELIKALFDTLPATDSLDQAGLQQLERARSLMAELFLRGVGYQTFQKQSGMTGFPVDPPQPGMERHRLMGDGSPCYFSLWLTDKDPRTSAAAIENVLRFRQQHMAGYADQFRMQLYIDIDTENTQFPGPYEAGLTPHAVCLEFGLADAEQQFAVIEAACFEVSRKAQRKLRVGLGSFALNEFEGFSKGSLFSKRMPFGMAMEWILFHNIHRRAGFHGWFWRLVAQYRDRSDN